MKIKLRTTLLIAGLALLVTLNSCDRSNQDCIQMITHTDASDAQIVKIVRSGKYFAIFFIPSEQDYQAISHATYQAEWAPLQEEDAFEMSPGHYVEGLTGSYVRANGKFGGLAYIVRLDDNKTLVAVLAASFWSDRCSGVQVDGDSNADANGSQAEPNPFDFMISEDASCGREQNADANGSQAEPNPFDFMISEDASCGQEQNAVLVDAIAAKDPAAVKAQVAAMSPEDLETYFYIEIAVEDCPPEIVEILIEAHQTPESRKEAGDVALNGAAMCGNMELARYLLAKGIGNPSRAVAWAAGNGDIGMTDLLLDAGASPNDALCVAALHGQSDLVLHLLDRKGADANAVDGTLEEPVLSLALHTDPANTSGQFWEGKINTMKILLQHGADPNQGKPLAGLCASWPWVAPEARLEALILLLEAGADALEKDKEGRTPREILTNYRDNDPENAATYDKAIELLRIAEEKAD